MFSNSLESLTQLPIESSNHKDVDEDSMKTVKQSSRKETDLSIDQEEEGAIASIFVNNEDATASEEFSGLTKSPAEGEHSKEMMNVIKGLDEKFELLDRRLSEMNPPQASVEQSSNQVNAEELEEKVVEIKELMANKSQLEKENQVLSSKISSLNSELSAERAKLLSMGVEFEQMKSLNESLTKDLSELRDKHAVLNDVMLPRSNKNLEDALKALKKRKDIIRGTKSRLEELETKMKELEAENERLSEELQKEKAQIDTMNEDSRQALKVLQLENKKKDKTIEEIQQCLSLTRSELESERSRTNEKVIELQNALLELKSAKIEKNKLEKQFSDFKQDIVAKNKEHSAAVKLVEKEKELLLNRLKDVEFKWKSVTEEKDDALIRLGTSDQREDELFNRLRESDRVRKELHARVMVLIGNIRVFVRVRPALPNEMKSSKHTEEIFKFAGCGTVDEKKSSKYGCDDPTKNLLRVQEPCKDRGGLSQRRKKWSFGFDSVFDPSHSQQDVWEATEPLVQCAIDGFSVTLFAYGQTVSNLQFDFIRWYRCSIIDNSPQHMSGIFANRGRARHLQCLVTVNRRLTRV